MTVSRTSLLLLITLMLAPHAVRAAGRDASHQIRTICPANTAHQLSSAEIDQILARRVRLQFDSTPLVGALQRIGQQHGLPIALDVTSLEEEGIGLGELVHSSLRNAPLGAGLNQLIDEEGLIAIRVPGGLLVLTHIEAETLLTKRSYHVGDLVARGLTLAELMELASDFTPYLGQPQQSDGAFLLKTEFPEGARLVGHGRMLEATGIFNHHAELGELLGVLRRALQFGRARSGSLAERRLESQLRHEVSVEWQSLTAARLVDELQERWQIPTHLDRISLEEEEIVPAVSLAGMNFRQIPLAEILNVLLRPAGLATINRGGVLAITTEIAAEEVQRLAAYDFRDMHALPWLTAGQLRELIQHHSSGRWSEYHDGVAGDIEIAGDLILIQQRPDIIAEIDQLMTALRRAATGIPGEIFSTRNSHASRKLWRLLNRRVSFPGGPGQLPVFLEGLRNMQIPVLMEPVQYDDPPIDLRNSLVPELQGVPVSVALDQVLHPLELDWRVESGAVWIAREATAEDILETLVIPVQDLLDGGLTPNQLMHAVYDHEDRWQFYPGKKMLNVSGPLEGRVRPTALTGRCRLPTLRVPEHVQSFPESPGAEMQNPVRPMFLFFALLLVEMPGWNRQSSGCRPSSI